MNWIDYAAIRSRIPMVQILAMISFRPTYQRGDQWRGLCPVCHGSNDRCFSVNVQRNIFRCFRCQRSGNQLDLWSAITGLALYDATLDLCRHRNIDPFDIKNPQPRTPT